jgi:thiol:disulfide interchange protein DsbG
MEQLFDTLEHSSYIKEGASDGNAIIYAFMDPDCAYCHYAWKAFQPYIKAGLQVRWLPIAFLKPTSAPRAAAILEAKEPARALAENEKNFRSKTEDGGITPIEPSEKAMQQLDANKALLARLGGAGTPMIVWKDKGGKLHTKSGMPSLRALPEMTGLPEQPVDDRELQRFH